MESNLFTVDKDEITVHWKVTVPDTLASEEQLAELTRLTGKLLTGLKSAGFKPDPGKAARKSGGNPNWKPRPKAMDADGNEIVCGNCGGEVWDNREKNKERESQGQRAMPEFKCKKECGWVKWPAREEEEIPFS